MFLKVQLPWNVILSPESLEASDLKLQESIIIRLLDDFAAKKATKDLGYYIAVTTLKRIGEGKVRQHTGDVLFPVVFSALTFKFCKGEILEGVVHKVMKHGVFLRCGPVESLYLTNLKMPDYRWRWMVEGFQKLKYVDFSTSYSIIGNFLRNLGSSNGGTLVEVNV
ncbi:hypothetical protein K1719_030621 [Acacia pycnantha]|nr:hypothetical protein K1719_030621 [Acacia pycnantha]